ncbi:MAG: hypothetical protein HKN13_01580 [Rhodothermales bacterium]|nr:hypothetical protein [Rhodothermales bacterium]
MHRYSSLRAFLQTRWGIGMLGFLVQWPTLPTLVMFPVLVVIYRRLALAEEREQLRTFGETYASYMKSVPPFIPQLRRDYMPNL